MLKFIKRLFGSETLEQEMSDTSNIDVINMDESPYIDIPPVEQATTPKSKTFTDAAFSITKLVDAYNNKEPLVFDVQEYMKEVQKKDPKELQKMVDLRLKEIKAKNKKKAPKKTKTKTKTKKATK